LSWEQYTYLFTATGLSTTLAFLNGDPSGDNNNGLDNIVLTDLGPTGTNNVPEPATLGLLGAGLAGVIGLWRKRKIVSF